jgi:type I restriction enzyme M protein
MMVADFTKKTKDLIDNLKGTCASYGLGNDGNESKIITQVFLYKFMNDKFGYDLKQIDKRFSGKESWEKKVSELQDSEFKKIITKLNPGTAKLKKEHLLSNLYNSQNSKNFSKLFDSTLIDISQYNASIFSVNTSSNAKIVLFDELSQFVSDPSRRDDFCRAIINQLVNFSFEEIFDQKFDFFSTIFEYLIKDYNKDGGGKYAEYYTPHAVSKIMAKILVVEEVKNVSVYDPSAGSGTLLMNVAHQIGEDKCSIYSQDVSQKSSGMLRLNLILNNLVHSIPNVIQGNTLTSPYFRNGKDLQQFDFIVSNPPFKLDFSDFRDELDSAEHKKRFFAGIPNIPAKKRESMAIYLLFLQHIIFSLSPKGKAAVVVPTGFLTGQDKISTGIRQLLIENNMLSGVVSMPSNIFATTGTNVSIIFIDKSKKDKDVLLVDASKLGETVKEGKNQKTVLSSPEEDKIIDIFRNPKDENQFSIIANSETIANKNYSFSAGQYFNIVLDLNPMSQSEYTEIMTNYTKDFQNLYKESREVEKEFLKQISRLELG